ncbi:hypothetical protein I5Q34_13485 [Streptomyces sp. AV19]|uniref:hypothetical protein n=1 Tax=Streptomyces sp. AV19 TaxID=2793068 RepID=UPI0018FE7A55|nr:hypothetical protein [Streptomyces sp. AV19]MBH1935272.1 hypothetical protein [Streptomyces sp. AV19]MDG4531159.1 hypothetical protein [Streptomyces sp. AV19]
MNPRKFRLAPVVAVATAGLLFAGTAGAAVAAPAEETPSATSSATGEATGSAPSEEADEQAKELKKSGWKADGWYHDEYACQEAGERGKDDHKWRDYKCKKEKRHGHWQWHLYYRK